MKRLLFSLVAMLSLLGWSIHAADPVTKTITFSEKGYSNGDDVAEVKDGDVTLTFALGENSKKNSPKYYNAGYGVRLYPANTLSISIADAVITSVEFTFHGNSYSFNTAYEYGAVAPIPVEFKSDNKEVGSYSESTKTKGSWTGSAQSPLVITAAPNGTKGSIRLQSVKITYSINATSESVSFNPAQLEQHAPFNLTLSTSTEGGKILYSIDGSEPTTEYTAPIAISAASTTVKAKLEGETEVITKTYTISTAAPEIGVAPTVNGANAHYCDNLISISAVEGAKVYYTTDGTEPSTSATEYAEPFVVDAKGTTTVKAIAVAESYGESSVASASVEIYGAGYPVFSPEAATYDEIPLEVSISSDTRKASIYYTVDGTDPKAEEAYLFDPANPIVINQTTTVKAIALLGNQKFNANNIKEAKYVIDAVGTEVSFNFGELQPGMAADDSDNWTGLDIPSTFTDATSPAVAEISKDDVSVTFNSLGSQANQKFRLWLTSGAVQLRISKGGVTAGSSFVVAAPEGKQITSIVFRTNSGSAFVSAFTPDMGTCAIEDKEVKWTGSASSVTFTGSDKYSGSTVQIMGIEVVCGESLAPVFNWNTGDYYESFNLTMTTGLAGGKIAYTTNGNDPDVTFDAATEKWVLGYGTIAYTAPVKIDATATIKAVAYGQRENPVNHIVENYVSDVTAAAYTFKTPDALPATVDNLPRLVKWFTESTPVNLAKSPQVNTPNINKVVRLPFALRVAARSKTELYVDDNAPEEENSGILVTRPNTDWTAICKPFDLFNEGWIVSFEWATDNAKVTPKLVLHNVPSLSIYEQPEFEIPVVTADAVIASAAWDQEIVENTRMHNAWVQSELDKGNNPGMDFMPVTDTDIKLINPSLVSELVEVKDVTFANSTRGNKGNTPNATFSGKSADGKTLEFVTRFVIDSYAAGTYDVKGIVAYSVEIPTKTVDKVKVPTDTIVSVMIYPTELTLVDGGGDITEKSFALADEASEGEWLFVASNMAFTPLDAEKTYGYMPVQEVKAEGDTINANAEFAVTLVATPDDPEYFYMKDNQGRYIYQTGNYDSFNVSTELPEDAEEASWTFEPTEDGEAWIIMNAKTGKFIQYSKQYNSYGCYAENTDDRVLPLIYRSTGTVTGIAGIEAPAFSGKTEIFNIQGQRMNGTMESLPAGIYLVRRGNHTSKVIVR